MEKPNARRGDNVRNCQRVLTRLAWMQVGRLAQWLARLVYTE